MKPYIQPLVQAMRGYTPGEQPSDPGILKLNTNENPYPPSPAVQRALRDVEPDSLRLYPDPLSLALRRRIAALHGAAGPELVFVGNGSDEGLALCTRAFVEDGGTIGYFDPSYSLYPVLANIRGAALRPVALGPAFEWAMPADCRADLFFLTTPNAPTGIQYSRADVAAFCARFPGVVVLDEAYVDFARESFLDLALSRPNVLVLRTLSKSYALAGLRLGYIVGAAPLIEALYKIKDSYNVDRLTQALALAAIGDQDYMRGTAARICATRDRTAAVLERLGCRVTPSQANFLWVRPPRLPAADLYRRLRERKILVRFFDGPRTSGFLRISIGTDAQMEVLLEAMRAILPKG